MRHYEILANGCMPYFQNIENCPQNTMYLLPKKLFIQSNMLYETKFKNKNINKLPREDVYEYYILQRKLLDYTKKYLTTEKIITNDDNFKYILTSSNCKNVSKVLFLSGNTSADYLRCLTLHGFKILFGNNCHDYPKIPHIYKSDTINYKTLYGKGITYTNLLEQNLHDDNLDDSIVENIKNKYYDIVIYGSYHRGMPYYDLISELYNANQIILLCGEDIHNCNHSHFVKNGHCVFVREL